MGPIQQISPRSAGQFFAIVGTVCAVAYALYGGSGGALANVVVLAIAVSIATAASAFKVAAPSDRAVVLRRGRLHALRGPGLFGINPIVDSVPYWINVHALPLAVRSPRASAPPTVDVRSAILWRIFDPATVAFSQPAAVAAPTRRPGPAVRRV